MVSRTLTVKITGDASQGEAAMLKFAKSLESAERTTNVTSSKIADDLRKMEEQAKKAAAANDQIGKVGTGGGITGGIADLLRNSAAGGSGTSAVLNKVADSLDTTAGKAALAGTAIAAAGVVATKFGVDAVQAFSHAAEAVDKFQDVTGASAEQSSVLVGAARELGVSSDTLANGMAKLARNAGTNEETLRKYGATVVRTKDGSVDLVATFQSVAAAYAANEDPTSRAILANAAFGKSWAQLTDVLERGGQQLNTALASAAKHAPIFSDDDLKKAKDFQVSVQQLKDEIEKFKVSIGGDLIGDMATLADAATTLADKLGGDGGLAGAFRQVLAGANPIHVIAEGLRGAEAAGSAVAGMFSTVGDEANHAGTGVHGMGEAARDGFAKLHGGAQVGVQDLGDVGGAADVLAGKLFTVASSFASAVTAAQSQNTATSALISSTGGWLDSLDAANGLMTQGTDNAQKLADAQTKGSQQISDAQAAVASAADAAGQAQVDAAKTAEDAARSVAQAQADLERTVADSQQRIADVDEQASRRIVDAQDRVTEARKRAEEAAVSSARRVQDAEQAVRDASVAALRDRDDYSAIRRRQEAEQSLSRAKEDAATQAQDSAGNVAKSETDLAQTEEDAAKARADARSQAADQIAAAEQRLADTQRQAADQVAQAQKQVAAAAGRVADAQQKMDRTTSDVARSLDDASRSAGGHTVSLQQAERAAQGVIDASPGFVLSMMQRGASIDEINTALAGGREKIEELGRAFGIPQPLIDALIGQLDTLVARLLAIRDLTPAAYDFAAAMKKAGQAFQDPATRALFDVGALEVVGAGTAVPHFAGGGVFRASTSGGAGLAVLHDREAVFTPEQQAALGGGAGDVHIHIAGSVLSERDLAAALANLDRLGYRTRRAS